MFPTRYGTNRAVPPQKMAIGLKFRIYVVEGVYNPNSESKCSDQHRGYREADLRLCFPICSKAVYSRRGSHLSLFVRKPVHGGSDQVRQKLDCAPTAELLRCWKFRIKEVEGSYYPCSENKGADQLRGYREAVLPLCFCICKKTIFSWRGSYDV